MPFPIASAVDSAMRHTASDPDSTIRVVLSLPDASRFAPSDFGIVGVFDVDWLVRPGFTEMLDNLAASPGAFSGVRFFGTFTAGQPDLFKPETSGTVWTDPDEPIDFTLPFAALAELTARGLTPFVVLGFFPPAVSPSPIQPPPGWKKWKRLVRAFLEQLAADSRFGADQIAHWWFEVWNEPNEGRFWPGTAEDYFALYQATSEAVVESGLRIRLGGPAIAYKPEVSPEDGSPWIERFLRFIASGPDLQCEFVSLHRKGTVQADPPDPRRLLLAAEEIAKIAPAIAPERFAGLTIINNEADEKVGFEVPYAPRMDHRAAAWLGAITVIHTSLAERYRAFGLRFMAAADNANLQLVQEPFDGRRSLMTVAPDSATDLLKLPVYGFYEMLRLLGDRVGTVADGQHLLFPATDLYHLATVADSRVGSLLAYYPDPGVRNSQPCTLDYMIEGLPWTEVNVALFRIDRDHSNSYTAAGGSDQNPFPAPDPGERGAIRQAQEVTVARPIARGVAVPGGRYRESLTLAPYTTLCLWITPVLATNPDAPTWFEIDERGEQTVLRWEPSPDPHFYSYEVFRMDGGIAAVRLTPDPLRAALWIDTTPPSADQSYGVRVVNASGIAGPLVIASS
jgi:hypothetical protein